MRSVPGEVNRSMLDTTRVLMGNDFLRVADTYLRKTSYNLVNEASTVLWSDERRSNYAEAEDMRHTRNSKTGVEGDKLAASRMGDAVAGPESRNKQELGQEQWQGNPSSSVLFGPEVN